MICQPLLLPLPSIAFIHRFCVPAKPALKLMARSNVRLVPDPEAEELPTFTVHWLFARVLALPSATPVPKLLPASFINASVLLPGRYCRKQELALAPEPT